MVRRYWRGWTTPSQADTYETIVSGDAREVLSRFDEVSAHYEVLATPEAMTDTAR